MPVNEGSLLYLIHFGEIFFFFFFFLRITVKSLVKTFLRVRATRVQIMEIETNRESCMTGKGNNTRGIFRALTVTPFELVDSRFCCAIGNV